MQGHHWDHERGERRLLGLFHPVGIRREPDSWCPVLFLFIYAGHGEYVGLHEEQEKPAPVWRGGNDETTPSGRQAEWEVFLAGADDDHIRWAINDLQGLEA